MVKKILLGLAGIVAVLALVVSMRPETYHIERSIEIGAPANVVWAEVSDFHRWTAWNPWQKSDPDQTIVVDGEGGTIGHSSRWEGPTNGKGKMTIKALEAPNHLLIQLDFDAPMEAQADTAFTLAPLADGVRVTWSMDGRNDFVGKLFGLVMDMEDMVGSAYAAGLADLKRVAESRRRS